MHPGANGFDGPVGQERLDTENPRIETERDRSIRDMKSVIDSQGEYEEEEAAAAVDEEEDYEED